MSDQQHTLLSAANLRPLNLNDLTFAWRLDEQRAEEIARPLLEELQALPAPAGRDDAGIPYRGGEVLREVIEEAPIEELAALYVTLFRQAAGTVVMDAVIFARGSEARESDR